MKGNWNVELLVVARVEIDGFTAILVFAKFRELHGGSGENSEACWIESDIVGWLYLYKVASTLSRLFFSTYVKT
jgi:hypothetical protein